MALFANVANRSKMNSLRMARPSRHKSVYTRKIEQKIKETKQKYDVQAIQSQRGQTVRRGGDPQRDWMRWRQPENAILDLLAPEARKQLMSAGLKINIRGRTDQAQYNPFSKTIDVRSGMSADDLRHELTHAGLSLTPDLFPSVGFRSKFANSALGTILGAMNTRLMPKLGQQQLAETPAITVGGAEAYPGYTPAFKPEQFSNFFDVEKASWQYSKQPGWTIGK